MTAHRDDSLGSHLLSGQHGEEADRAVTYDRDRHARLHVSRIGGEPAGAQDVGGRQQTRDQVVRRNVRSGHQGAVREGHAQHRRLRPANELAVDAR